MSKMTHSLFDRGLSIYDRRQAQYAALLDTPPPERTNAERIDEILFILQTYSTKPNTTTTTTTRGNHDRN